MSQRLWTEAITRTRRAEAKKVYAALAKTGWGNLSQSDRRMMEALGYLSLETDDVQLATLTDSIDQDEFEASADPDEDDD